MQVNTPYFECLGYTMRRDILDITHHADFFTSLVWVLHPRLLLLSKPRVYPRQLRQGDRLIGIKGTKNKAV